MNDKLEIIHELLVVALESGKLSIPTRRFAASLNRLIIYRYLL